MPFEDPLEAVWQSRDFQKFVPEMIDVNVRSSHMY